MHMADALISPAVGASMWTATVGLIAYSSKKIKQENNDSSIPIMGVLGAFIFAAQMINFSIPLTGSSGHLGGGLILAILLGPYAGFITMASVLTVQALFFADGGLLALGCNIFNLGFFPCFIVYPFIYKKLISQKASTKTITWASMIAATIGLQMGAFSVVLETLFSGISELPFSSFLLLMQPIHLAIGIVEGFVTAAVIVFVFKNQPEILNSPIKHINKKVLNTLLVATIFIGAVLSWFASTNPDGLEWSMFKTSGTEELTNKNVIHTSLEQLQEKTALLPDYNFKPEADIRPEIGTSFSGLLGSTIILLLIFFIGLGLKRPKQKQNE